MSDSRFDTEQWQDSNGVTFDVAKPTEDLTDLWVDGSRRNVAAGETLIFSGSDTVGYFSFNADQYREWGCNPTPDAANDPAPAHAQTDPSTNTDPTTSTDPTAGSSDPASTTDPATSGA